MGQPGTPHLYSTSTIEHKATGMSEIQINGYIAEAHLGCHVRQTPTSLREGPLLPGFLQHEHGRETKVGDFERAGCVEEEVLGLEIPVADALLVDVILR